LTSAAKESGIDSVYGTLSGTSGQVFVSSYYDSEAGLYA